MATVTKLSIGTLVIAFILYVIAHTAIGFALKRKKAEMKEKPGNTDLEQSVKMLNIVFKWFPAIAVVVTLIMFYM